MLKELVVVVVMDDEGDLFFSKRVSGIVRLVLI